MIKRGIKIANKTPELGILIETPAAALISEQLSKKCDFFAINDGFFYKKDYFFKKFGKNLKKCFSNFYKMLYNNYCLQNNY